jgi:hypothetical protein
VTIDHRANGSGTVQVRYKTLEQLDEVVRRLETAPRRTEPNASGPRIRSL